MAKPTDALPHHLLQEMRPKSIAARRAERGQAADEVRAREAAAARLAEELVEEIQQEYTSYAVINRKENELSVKRNIPHDDCLFITVEDADRYLVGYEHLVAREELDRDTMLDRLDYFLTADE